MKKCTGKIVDCDGPYDCYDPSDDECYKSVSQVKPQPKKDEPKPKKDEPKPKTFCLDNYGNEISINSVFVDAEFKTEEGLKAFKEYLKKYYKDLVTNIAGTTDKLDSAKLNDCIVVKLYNSVDPVRKLIIGDYVYDFWKDYVGGWKNSTSKTELEYNTWLKSDSQDNISTIAATKEDWQKLIDNGQISNKGKLISWDGVNVMLFKYDKDENRVDIKDDINADGKIDTQKIISNINNNKNIYRYFKYPFPNENEEDKNEYPLKCKRYSLIVKKDANNVNYLDTDTTYKIVKIKKAKSKIDEMSFKKFILEKIREKNKSKTIFVEALNTPQPTGTPNDDSDRDEVEGSESESQISSSTQKKEDDIFGLNNPQNSLTTNEAKKNFINTKGTPVLQNLINKGSRSQNFVDWNNLAIKLGANKLTFKDKNNVDVTIDQNNAFNVGVPGQLGNYTEQPFYNVLNITGDPTKNTAKIYTPISITNKQAYLDVKVSIPFCRTQLINYLKDALGKTFSGTPQQRWNRKYEICGCNERGGFDTFKFYRKLPNLGKTTTGREKLDIRPGSSVFTQTGTYENPETGEQETTIGGVSQASPFIPVFNKKLNWKEIKKLITGGTYTNQSGVKDTIDEELIIDGFDGAGSLCSSNKFKSAYPYAPEVTNNELQKESFDKRIDNKLLESIRNKNNKENLVEDVLRRILKK